MMIKKEYTEQDLVKSIDYFKKNGVSSIKIQNILKESLYGRLYLTHSQKFVICKHYDVCVKKEVK